MKKRWLVVLVISLVGISGLFLFLNGTSSQRNLEFNSSDCKWGGYFKYLQGVRNMKWLDDSTIEILAQVPINCADSIKDGSYKITDNKIFLDYSVKENKLLQADCFCDHNLIYKISNIEKRDYEIILRGYEDFEIILRGYEDFEISCEGLTDENYELQSCCQTLAKDRGLDSPEDEESYWGLYNGECKIIYRN